MHYYVVNLLIVLLLAYIAQRGHSRSRFMILGLALVPMVLLAALRSYSVGTDTGDYFLIFHRIRSLSEKDLLDLDIEPGFAMLNWVIAQFTVDFYFVLAAIAIIVVSLYIRTLMKYAVNYEIAFLTFICMGVYTFFFNGARQGIAAAIGAFALQFLLERRLLAYFLCVVVATFFHKTAMILLPVYFLAAGYNTLARNLVIVLVGVALAFSFNGLVSAASTLNERYDAYGVAGSGGGGLTATVLVLIASLFLWFKKSVNQSAKVYHISLNMFLIGVMIAIVAVAANVNPSGVLRLSFYFTWVQALIWPILFMNIHDQSKRKLFMFLFFCFCLIYYMVTLSSFGSMLPYKLNPIIFSG